MKFNYFTTKIPFFGALSLIFLVSACGSYEYVGYDNDGIYGSDNNRTVEYPTQQETVVEGNKNDGTYYKNYFSEKANELDYALNSEEIFTDVDSYESDYNNEQDSLQYKGYAGWGQNNSNVTINVIDRGWSNWGWYDPWLWDPYWNVGWGWNNWAWGRPWGWNAGFGWGWNTWGYGYPYYGYGYNYYGNPYYNNYYGNYNRRGIAYNAGRRGSYLNRDITGTNRVNRSGSRINSNSLSSRNRSQFNENNRSTRTRSTTRSSTTRNNSPRAKANRKSSPRVSTPRSSNSRPSVSTPRSSSSRSSGSVSRSSSSSRSSGSRSSGSSRSSSRRN